MGTSFVCFCMILNVPGKLLPGSWYVPGRFRKKRPTICIKWSHLLLTGLFNVGEHKRAPMEFVLTQGPEQDLSAIFPGRKPALTPNLKPRIMQKLLFFWDGSTLCSARPNSKVHSTYTKSISKPCPDPKLLPDSEKQFPTQKQTVLIQI